MIKRVYKIIFLLSICFLYFGEANAGVTEIFGCQNLDITGETYILQNNITTDGSCFTFTADNIVLDLNGHTLTYANLDFEGAINPGFEIADGDELTPLGWDLSGAHGRAYRQDYTQRLFFDNYSLNITNLAGDAYPEEYVLTSPIYLPVAGKYAMTAEIKGGPYGAFTSHLEIEGIDVTCGNEISNMHLSATTDMSWGLVCEFDISSPATVRGKVVLGTTDNTKTTSLSIDEVDIRPIGFSGVAISGYNRRMAEIKNGSIIEGRSKAIYSPAIYKTSAVKIHDLNIVTNGINSPNISEYWAGGMEIYDNYMEANGKLPLNRQYAFSMIDLGATDGGNKIYNNTLMNGPHVGISHGGGLSARSEIYGNTIKTRVNATNGFSISAGANVDIHDNIIDPIQGHGIGLGRDSDNTRIYNNIIKPKSWPCSEYSSYGYPNSAHGIRIKNYGSGILENVEIFGNTIIGSTNPQLNNCYTEVSGITNYLGDDSGGGVSDNVKIHDNNISVTTDNYLQQHAMAYKTQGQGEIYNNTFESNHIILDMSDGDVSSATQYKAFDSNTLIKNSTPQAGFYTIRYGYNFPGDNVFSNILLQGGADLNDISYGINNAGRTYSDVADLSVNWYVDFLTKDSFSNPLVGVSVSVYDKDGILAIQKITDTKGTAFDALGEYIYSYKSSAEKGFTFESPYRFVFEKSGYKSLTVDSAIDSSKKISVTLVESSSLDNSVYLIENITYNPFTLDYSAPEVPQGLNVF